MIDGATFLGFTAVICALCFANGVRFARMPADHILAGGLQVELPAFLARGRTRIEQARLVGHIQMFAAPILFLFFFALSLGLLGPVDGITPIQF